MSTVAVEVPRLRRTSIRRNVGRQRSAGSRPRVHIKEHNARIKRAVQERTVTAARRGLLYHTDWPRPRLVLLPTRSTYDPDCGCKPWPEDFDVDNWFNGAHMMVSINYFPGTTCRLKNGYDIFVLARRERQTVVAPMNGGLRRLFALTWPGNIVVMKRGFRDYGCALHITPSEISLINTLVQRWLQMELCDDLDDD